MPASLTRNLVTGGAGAAVHWAVEDDPTNAERWYWACANLIKPDQCVDATQVDENLIQRKREVLIQGFGRAKGLLDAAMEWREPRIEKTLRMSWPLCAERSGGM